MTATSMMDDEGVGRRAFRRRDWWRSKFAGEFAPRSQREVKERLGFPSRSIISFYCHVSIAYIVAWSLEKTSSRCLIERLIALVSWFVFESLKFESIPSLRVTYYSPISTLFAVFGVPCISCASVLAHCFLQSGRHSLRDFCSAPFGLVHSYMPE